MNVRSGATSEGGDCLHDSDSDGLCDFQLAGDYQIQSIALRNDFRRVRSPRKQTHKELVFVAVRCGPRFAPCPLLSSSKFLFSAFPRK